nr:type III-B CRISPR module RAMP protein Cmr1 [Candidatus Freyarchaeota archaeon]
MSAWSELQRHISAEDLIAEIKIASVTPIRTGGYNSRPYSPELGLTERPRTQALKGLWRWWARTILGGAKISANQNLPKNLYELDKEISDLFGSTDSSSKFTIQLIVDEKGISYLKSDLMRNVPRIKLVSMGEEQRRERYYYTQTSIILRARRIKELTKEEAMFGLSSLLISLFFSGIGSIVNRGFGKLKIINLLPGPRFKNDKDLNELKKILLELYKTGEEITSKIKELIKKSLEYASSYKGYGAEIKGVSIDNIPPYSVLLPDCSPPIFRMETILVPGNKDISQILECIGKSTMKTEWKNVKGMPPRSVGKNFHTWILGLPRYQSPPYEEKGKKVHKLTGYTFDKSEETRRQSPIGFTVLKLDSGEYCIVIYGFLTSEYAQQLSKIEHTGIHVDRRHISGVIGVVKSVIKTDVYNDIIRGGIETPSRVVKVTPGDTVSIYQKCFDAAYDFIKEIIRGCLR